MPADAVPPVRAAEPGDLAVLPGIDRAAETLFEAAGLRLPVVPYSVDALRKSKAVFVLGSPPVGFAQLDEVDGQAHLHELAVLPSHTRRGLGSKLLAAACRWAGDTGYAAITLTTFADVSWNAPFYAARGFRVVTTLTPQLSAIRDDERAIGLDAVGPRVAMQLDLRRDAGPPIG